MFSLHDQTSNARFMAIALISSFACCTPSALADVDGTNHHHTPSYKVTTLEIPEGGIEGISYVGNTAMIDPLAEILISTKDAGVFIAQVLVNAHNVPYIDPNGLLAPVAPPSAYSGFPADALTGFVGIDVGGDGDSSYNYYFVQDAGEIIYGDLWYMALQAKGGGYGFENCFISNCAGVVTLSGSDVYYATSSDAAHFTVHELDPQTHVSTTVGTFDTGELPHIKCMVANPWDNEIMFITLMGDVLLFSVDDGSVVTVTPPAGTSGMPFQQAAVVEVNGHGRYVFGNAGTTLNMITNNGSSNPDTAVVNFPAGHHWSGPIAGLCISGSKAFVSVGDSSTKALVGVVNGIATDSPSYQDHAIPLFNNSTTLPRLTAIQAVIPSGTATSVVGTYSGLGPPIGYWPEFYEILKTGGVGDLDEDGDVDTDDLAEMQEDLGLCASDVDQDGDTDVMDLLHVIDQWGETCP